METRYKITTAAGAVFTGYVQGSGGRLREANRGLDRLRRMADTGDTRRIAGPPGHVLLDPLSPHDDNRAGWVERMAARVAVPITGATINLALVE